MRLTIEDLVARGACRGAQQWFQHYFPDGVDVTMEALGSLSPGVLQNMASGWTAWLVEFCLPHDRALGYFSDKSFDERLGAWAWPWEQYNRTALRQFIELAEGLTEWKKP